MVTQVTTCCNQGMQQNIFAITCKTFKQMGFSTRRPQWVPLPSAKIRKLSLQFARSDQNLTSKIGITLSDMLRLCFCCEIQMAGSYRMKALIKTPLPISLASKHHLNVTAYPSIVAYPVYTSGATVYPISSRTHHLKE